MYLDTGFWPTLTTTHFGRPCPGRTFVIADVGEGRSRPVTPLLVTARKGKERRRSCAEN